MKMVYDADNEIVIEYFQELETEKIIDKYNAIGKWNDISVDIDGHICLWKE